MIDLNFDPKEYRENLAKKIEEEPDKKKKKEILEEAKKTYYYKQASNIERTEKWKKSRDKKEEIKEEEKKIKAAFEAELGKKILEIINEANKKGGKENFESFDDIKDGVLGLEMAKKIIESEKDIKKIDFILDNINKFDTPSREYIVDDLIENYWDILPKGELKKVKKLVDSNNVLSFIEKNGISDREDADKKFLDIISNTDNLNKEVALKILDKGQNRFWGGERFLGKLLGYFKNLDKDIAMRLIEFCKNDNPAFHSNRIFYIFGLGAFKGLDDEVAEELIKLDSHNKNRIGQNWDSFKLSDEIIKKYGLHRIDAGGWHAF